MPDLFFFLFFYVKKGGVRVVKKYENMVPRKLLMKRTERAEELFSGLKFNLNLSSTNLF
jgi:hypothetical protein